METLTTWLQHLQLAIFLGAATAAFRLWWIQRGRPAAFLALTFGTLGLALVLVRFGPDDGTLVARVIGDVGLVGLAAFPWLLALFAWSFEPRLPPWLLAAGSLVVGLAVWKVLLPPLPDDPADRSPMVAAYILTFVTVWAVLSFAAAVRLWTGGGQQPLVRVRMRTMALGALLITVALLLAGTAPPDQGPVLPLVVHALAAAAALLFVLGFAPPRSLRMWWRRGLTEHWHRVQSELISALTPEQAAKAVTPLVSQMLGTGVAVVADDGELLASAGMGREEAHDAADRVKTGQPPAPEDDLIPAGETCVIMRKTAHTPLFGQDERDLIAGFALQLQLAMERAKLFDSHERTRRSLQRANEELQAMSVGLAHDLRNAAITINGYADLLPEMHSPEERAQAVEGIQRSADYLNRLIESLVQLSRVGAGPRQPEPVDLGEILSRVRDRLAASHPQMTVVADPLPRVLASPLAMEQVFENLLTNAAKHGGREDLTITVRSRTEGPNLVIEVADDGAGIHPSDRDGVFIPFQRGRNASGTGSGIGLGLVRRIIENHDGSIELVDADAGACFRIVLPVTKP